MTALGALVVAALAAAPAAARPLPPGSPRIDRPLGVDTPGTLRQLVLDQPLADARPSGTSLELRWSLANDWTLPTRLVRGGQLVEVQLDEQADRLEVLARVPWARLGAGGWPGERVETALAWRLVEHWGGFTDGVIEGWHRLGRFGTFGRSSSPRDRVAVRLGVPGGARLVDLDRPRLAVGDLAISTLVRLAAGERTAGSWAVVTRLDLKAPLGRPTDAGSSGGVDAGLGVAGSVALLPWLTGHAQAAARRVAPFPGEVPLRLRPWQLGADVSLVAWRGDWALALESRWLSALFERGWTAVGQPARGDAVVALTRPQNQITAGVRWRAITVWFSEDWTPGARREVGWRRAYNSNAPDVVAGLSVVQAI